MTNAIIEDMEALLAKVKAEFAPAVKIVENDAHDMESAAWTYIKANGLKDLYEIAMTVLTAAIPGASWAATLASIEAQAVADGKQLVAGATDVVANQAKADLVVAGKLLPSVAAPAA